LTDAERKQVKVLWLQLSAYYQYPLKEEVFEMYVQDVEDLSFDEIKVAMEKYRRNGKNNRVPLPGSIRALARPELDPDTQAREAAARVIQAISKFGYTNPTEARAWIGELGWRAVQRFGGWQYLCENTGVELSVTTLMAQVRDIASTTIKLGEAGIYDQPLGLPEPEKKKLGLQSASDVLKQLPFGKKEEHGIKSPGPVQGGDVERRSERDLEAETGSGVIQNPPPRN
jgi:hypothetical protein